MTLPLPTPSVEPVHCRNCRRICRHGTVDGLGPGCARNAGLTSLRLPAVRSEAADQQDLLDLINEGDHMTIKTFRKKPVEIQAMRWADPEDAYALAEWAGGDITYDEHTAGPSHPDTGEDWGRLAVTTLEGEHVAAPGDWLIKGVQGEFYFCKREIFEATYEPADA